jgi:uncharacterized protein (TIGR03000 family)
MRTRPILSTWTLVLLAAAPAWGQPAPKAQPAILVVHLPEAEARLEIDGAPTRLKGTERRFESPPLEPGKSYSYTLIAFWEPNNYTKITRTRKASVRAGQTTEVDLRKADPAQPDKIVIRWVPTPPEVVKAMLELAGVGKDDVVYDLGCGDGRIVIAAVKDFKAKKAIGFDIDPKQVDAAQANVKKNDVSDLVSIERKDIFDLDLSKASVVTLYLLPTLNVKLIPQLNKMKPGSRVVSHAFDMEDLVKPKKKSTVMDKEGNPHDLFLWEVPLQKK